MLLTCELVSCQKQEEAIVTTVSLSLGIPNHMHMGTGPPPQFNRMEEMVKQRILCTLRIFYFEQLKIQASIGFCV